MAPWIVCSMVHKAHTETKPNQNSIFISFIKQEAAKHQVQDGGGQVAGALCRKNTEALITSSNWKEWKFMGVHGIITLRNLKMYYIYSFKVH